MDIIEANELLRPLRDLFVGRYLNWALNDTLDQCSKGFPLLRRVKSSSVRYMLNYIDSLDYLKRETLVKAAWKSSCSNYGRRDFPLMPDELKLLEELRGVGLERYAHSPPTGDPNQFLLKSRRLFTLRKNLLREEINKSLIPVLGGSPQRLGPQEWQFQSRVGGWKVFTVIDVGGKWQLRYEHKVGLSENVYLAEYIDLQGWMGLGHTKWDEIVDSDVAQAASDLAEICTHFLRAVPSFLEGLRPPSGLSP